MAIYCIGRNYANHAQELGNEIPAAPIVFLKAESSLRPLSHGVLAFSDEVFHHELELVLCMGRNLELGAKVQHTDIESIALGIDLTRRETQSELKNKGLPWTISKSFAGSAIIGQSRPYSEVSKSENITFKLWVNDELRQVGETKHMIFPFLSLCNYINSFSSLRKGDLIYTGTPEGVGPARKGDRIETQFQDEEKESGIL